jgi:TldD protein
MGLAQEWMSAKLTVKGGLMQTKEWLKEALDDLSQAGVDYADARYLDCETESITVRNEQVAGLSRSRDCGFGIRALYKGSWGFAASAQLTESDVMKTARRALEVARASYLTQREPIRLDNSPPHVGS